MIQILFTVTLTLMSLVHAAPASIGAQDIVHLQKRAMKHADAFARGQANQLVIDQPIIDGLKLTLNNINAQIAAQHSISLA